MKSELYEKELKDSKQLPRECYFKMLVDYPIVSLSHPMCGCFYTLYCLPDDVKMGKSAA